MSSLSWKKSKGGYETRDNAIEEVIILKRDEKYSIDL